MANCASPASIMRNTTRYDRTNDFFGPRLPPERNPERIVGRVLAIGAVVLIVLLATGVIR